MNRGSAAPSDQESTSGAGFNEAPIHESGKSTMSVRRRRPETSFNEAPIHESGKSQRCLLVVLRTSRGFNEAPIHESGKL